ncbi:TrmB family transcriptional regulator [Edaphobacillus lindanitolerans]|uniref:Sugar-specific transcriptional regulator TrmB n=1 Tax=Edaphobacillus lindanitolerans TaxID=550447 RepID=A0A1U7PLF4_9BACI|nr:helix-turn-helix domain-containing protein [Edaphobacillus lindanitolerans]SIT73793.1 Sugar-specific transcriptional regulator TrmB [Edaphobacillus lindanitolerans]
MKTDKALSTLKKYGFTEYEAKIYMALLERHPLNGNEIATQSGVPNPKVYEALKRLTDRNVIFNVSEGTVVNKKLYSPLPYDELLQSLKAEFEEDHELLDDYFKNLSTKNNVDWSELYHISGYAASLEALKELINGAADNIYISCWNEELIHLMHELKEAESRGVKVVSISFDQPEAPVTWHHYHHHVGAFSDKRHIGELSCAVDDRRVFILHSAGADTHSIISSHAALIRTTINYIRHDIYINQVVKDFPKELVKQYGDQFERLLNRF